MKPPPFDYLAAESLEEAVRALAADEDAKVLAGGQSLIPLLSLRLARPSVLVDIGRLDLGEISINGTTLRIGALVPHTRVEHDPIVAAAVPLLADATAQVGYPAIRNRGTLGGSLAHADPVAEIPAAAVALGALVVVTGPQGQRRLLAADLADGYFSTVLEPAEIIVAVEFPFLAGRGHGAAWCEWSPRAHDFADAGVGIALEIDEDGTCRQVRAAAAGMAAHPVDLTAVVEGSGVLGANLGRPVAGLFRAVAAAVTAAGVGAGDDKAELAGLLAARALHKAIGRTATGSALAA